MIYPLDKRLVVCDDGLAAKHDTQQGRLYDEKRRPRSFLFVCLAALIGSRELGRLFVWRKG